MLRLLDSLGLLVSKSEVPAQAANQHQDVPISFSVCVCVCFPFPSRFGTLNFGCWLWRHFPKSWSAQFPPGAAFVHEFGISSTNSAAHVAHTARECKGEAGVQHFIQIGGLCNAISYKKEGLYLTISYKLPVARIPYG